MGNIFAIKKYAIHDGPNIRTTVFFKGCPLSCHWCHNPEGLKPTIDIVWLDSKCVGCLECIDSCAQNALSMSTTDIFRDLEKCQGCRKCAEICPALAHEPTGRIMGADDVIAEIKKDIPFYDQSGGGVTFSGGEPLMQPGFLMELLVRCQELGIHRAVDTSAYAKTELILEVAEVTDLFLIDLKHMDSRKHELYTGVQNHLILDNISRLAGDGKAIAIRIPLIYGVNTDEENMSSSADFVASLPGVRQVDLLPYHSIAAAKYRKLNMANPGESFTALSKDDISRCTSYFIERGLAVQVGG